MRTRITIGSLLHRVRSGTAAAEKRDDRPEIILSILSREIFLKSPDTDLLFPNILVFFGSKKDLIPFLGPNIALKQVKPTFTKGQTGKHALSISFHVVQIIFSY